MGNKSQEFRENHVENGFAHRRTPGEAEPAARRKFQERSDPHGAHHKGEKNVQFACYR
jgi:hypothetical protein